MWVLRLGFVGVGFVFGFVRCWLCFTLGLVWLWFIVGLVYAGLLAVCGVFGVGILRYSFGFVRCSWWFGDFCGLVWVGGYEFLWFGECCLAGFPVVGLGGVLVGLLSLLCFVLL